MRKRGNSNHLALLLVVAIIIAVVALASVFQTGHTGQVSEEDGVGAGDTTERIISPNAGDEPAPLEEQPGAPAEDEEEPDTTRETGSLPGDISSCQEIDYGPGIYTVDDILTPNGTCFNITVDNVVIDCQDYYLNGNGSEYAIVANSRNNITIKNCIASGFDGGFDLTGANNTHIINNTFMNIDLLGIRLNNSHYNEITQNTFEDSVDYGIGVYSSGYFNTISFNIIEASINSIFASNASYVNSSSLISNQMMNCSDDNVDIDGANLTIFNNSISDSGTGDYGLRLRDCPGSNITLNNLTGHSTALFLDQDISGTIIEDNFFRDSNGALTIAGNDTIARGNTFRDNSGSALYLTSEATNTTVFSNIFDNNVVGVKLNGVSFNNISFNNLTANGEDISINAFLDADCDNLIQNNTGYEGRDILYYNSTTTLEDESLSGLILCNADDSVFNNISILNSGNGTGIIIYRTNHTNITGFNINNVNYGVKIGAGSDNIIDDTNITNVSYLGIKVYSSTPNNKFINVSVTSTSTGSDIESNGNGTELIDTRLTKYAELFGTLILEDTRYGRIAFNSSLGQFGGENLSSDIQIGNNSAYVNSSKTGLNKSATISFYDIRTDFNNPVILVDDSVPPETPDGLLCSTSVCKNLTNLNAGDVDFNVTHWTTYYVGENFTQLTDCTNLTTANWVYKLEGAVNSTGTCFNITAENVTLDCRGWNNKITYGNSSSTDTAIGIFSEADGTIIQNCEITMGKEADGSLERYAIYLNDSSNGTIFNINASGNRQGIVIEGGSNYNDIFDNIANNNEQTGIYIITNNGNTITNNTANNNKFGIRIYWESDNNTMQNNTANDNSYAGFYLGPDADNNVVQYNNASGNPYGVMIEVGTGNEVSFNDLYDNDYGVIIHNQSDSNNISYNTIAENDYGVVVNDSDSNYVNYNTVENNTRGVQFLGVSSGYIQGNDITNNDWGINLSNGVSSVQINSNNISYNPLGGINVFGTGSTISSNVLGGNSAYGIKLDSNCQPSVGNIDGNNISGSVYGIDTSSLLDNIYTNRIIDNDYGIYLRNASCGYHQNDIYNNYFDNVIANANATDLLTGWSLFIPSTTNIIGGPNIGGNYWGDYYGNDTNGDGFGNQNVPWNATYSSKISGTVSDSYPLTDVNTMPAISQIFVNSSTGTNYSSDNLTCWVNATDAEGYAINYDGLWYKNGNFSHNITSWNEEKEDMAVYIWNKVYDGGIDVAFGIAIDNEGNVYVTGESYNSLTSSVDYYTVKYYPNGHEIWSKSYYGYDNNDRAKGIAIDNEGNVYVTGNSYNASGTENDDYYTLKYNGTNGNVIWNKAYDGTGSDVAYGIATDSSNDVYVTGESYNASGTENNDYYTIKYNGTNGNVIWSKDYDGPCCSDAAYGIATDNDGNVYVTGYSYNASGTGNADYYTIKYNGINGNVLWEKPYDGSNSDYASAIATDNDGNVYVTGYSVIAGNNDYYTIKYNGTNGEEIWNKSYNGLNTDGAEGVATDNDGNVYVTGHSFIGGNNDYYTLKYNGTNGNTIWNKSYSTSGADVAYGIATDSSNGVYVTGYSYNASGTENNDYYTIKYESQLGYPSGSFVSSTPLDSSYTTRDDNWSCNVSATDGIVPGPYNMSANLTVLNSPPYFDPALEDKEVAEGSRLYYDINCTDADGDPLLFYINDTSKFDIYTGTGVDGIIDWTPNYTDAGIYSYNITCGDGNLNASDAFSVNVTNTNRLPVISSIILNSSSGTNYDTENLTAHPIGVSDADSEPIKNITTWYKNSASIMALNMPAEAGSLNGNSTGVANAAKDYSGNANNGNATNALWSSTGGYDGKGAYHFDGTGDWIRIEEHSSLALDYLTLSAWIYPESVGGAITRTIISKRMSGSPWYDYGLSISGSDSKLRFWIANSTGSGTNVLYDTAIVANQWYYITATYNGSVAKLYINGTLVNSTTNLIGSLNHSGYPLKIGTYSESSVPASENFNGTIDEVVIYNYALSSEQATALYENRTDLIVSNETSSGDVWKACITPNDGLEDGAEVCSNIITIGVLAVCGNDVCESGETCSNCPADCGTCPSGGGGGGGTRYSTFMPSESQLSTGYTETYSKNDRTKFYFKGEMHYVTLDSISSTAVTVTVSSLPQTFNLGIYQQKKLDINGDGIYDLLVQLTSLNYPTKANLYVKKIVESLVYTPPVAPPTEAPAPEAPPEEYLPPEPERKINLGDIRVIVTASIAGLILAVLIIAFAMRLRHKRLVIARGKEWYADAKRKGYSDKTINRIMHEKGWEREDIKDVVQTPKDSKKK